MFGLRSLLQGSAGDSHPANEHSPSADAVEDATADPISAAVSPGKDQAADELMLSAVALDSAVLSAGVSGSPVDSTSATTSAVAAAVAAPPSQQHPCAPCSLPDRVNVQQQQLQQQLRDKQDAKETREGLEVAEAQALAEFEFAQTVALPDLTEQESAQENAYFAEEDAEYVAKAQQEAEWREDMERQVEATPSAGKLWEDLLSSKNSKGT